MTPAPVARILVALVGLGMVGAAGPGPAHGQDPAELLVVVRAGDTGAAIPSANVLIVELSGGGITDDRGWFLTGGLLPGTVTLAISHLGYETVQAEVPLEAGKRTRVEAILDVEPVEHAPIEVEGRRGRTQAFREFYERVERRGGGGGAHFITRERIEQIRPRHFSGLLREVPSMRLDCSNWQQCTLSTRSTPITGVTGDCPVQFYVNGVYQPYSDINMLNPDHIEGVEIYARGRGAPGRYTVRKNSRCGVVLVWLRQGGE